MEFNVKKFICWLLLIVWMIIIFMFSNKPATVSSSESQLVLKLLSNVGIDLYSMAGNIAETIVRKSAHMFEYYILFFLIYNVMSNKLEFKVKVIMSIVFVFLYACTDEFHQYFVDGRAARFTDVVVDTCGALIGTVTLIVLKRLSRNVSYIKYNG